MKRLILSTMAAVMLATSAFAMSPALDADGWRDYGTVHTSIINKDTVYKDLDIISDWNNFWGTLLPHVLDPATTGWDEFFGNTLNPDNTGWNDLWGTVVPTTLDPANSGWDGFFGTAFDPAHSGWNDFWFQCQDLDKTTGDCVGTVFAGVGLAMIAPWAIAGSFMTAAIYVAGTIPMVATGLVPASIFTAGGGALLVSG